MGLVSIGGSRLAGAISLLALVVITVSDFFLTGFWDENAMVTSIVADILVLIVGVAVVNEFLAARGRSRWQLVADYAIVELARSCRRIWVGLAEQIGVGKRKEMTRDALRRRLHEHAGLEELARQAAETHEQRGKLYEVVSELVFDARAGLTSWAGVLVESKHSGALARFAEMQALLARLDLVLWEESQGRQPSAEEEANPAWIAHRICTVMRLGSQLEVQLFAQAGEIEARERRELEALRGPAPDAST